MRFKQYLYAGIFIVLFALAIFNLNLLPESITGSIYRSTPDFASEQELNNSRYKLSFKVSKAASGNINIYVPQYISTDSETANYYAKLFDIHGSFHEDEECYNYSDGAKELIIYKHMSLIEYKEAAPAHSCSENASRRINDEEAVDIAASFLNQYFLLVTYEEAKVDFDGQHFTVYFIGRLGNLKDYGFPTRVTVNGAGAVEEAAYYYITCERVKVCKIKSMYEAYRELPEDIGEETSVDLQKCQLVYYYDESILQPAYLFEGETPGGKAFECFVKAAVYQ